MNDMIVVGARREIGHENYWFISLAGHRLDYDLMKKFGEAIRQATTIQHPRGILISLTDMIGYDQSSDFLSLITSVVAAVAEHCKGVKLAFVMAPKAIAKAKTGRLDMIVGLYEDEEVAIANRSLWPAT